MLDEKPAHTGDVDDLLSSLGGSLPSTSSQATSTTSAQLQQFSLFVADLSTQTAISDDVLNEADRLLDMLGEPEMPSKKPPSKKRPDLPPKPRADDDEFEGLLAVLETPATTTSQQSTGSRPTPASPSMSATKPSDAKLTRAPSNPYGTLPMPPARTTTADASSGSFDNDPLGYESKSKGVRVMSDW
jgi:hypothetical protein